MGTKTLALAAALSTLATAGMAATVDQSIVQVYSSNGQDLTYNFTGLELAAGNSATITIAPVGGAILGLDLGGQPDEFFDVIADGANLGSFSCDGNTGSEVIPGNDGSVVDCEFELTLNTLDRGFDFNGNLGDGALSIVLDFADDVNDFGDNDEVSVRLSYDTVSAVPVPAGGLLLASGLAGIAAMRRRKAFEG